MSNDNGRHPIPHSPHPDVHILVGLGRELKPGEKVTKDQAAKAIGCTDPMIVLRRMTAARKILEREFSIVLWSVPGEGWQREDAVQTTARAMGREVRGIHRKARRMNTQLSAHADAVAGMDEPTRASYFAARTIGNIALVATSRSTKTKALAIAQATSADTPMAQAVKMLGDLT